MCLLSAAPVMSYAQLESLINKWSSELEDQERHFLQQATQVNAWDRMLVENGEKVAGYNNRPSSLHAVRVGGPDLTTTEHV